MMYLLSKHHIATKYKSHCLIYRLSEPNVRYWPRLCENSKTTIMTLSFTKASPWLTLLKVKTDSRRHYFLNSSTII